MNHLTPESQALALKSDSERIEFVRGRIWIPYPIATEIIELFNDLVSWPRGNKMPNYLLVGQANNGKTEILMEFASRYEPKNVPGKGRQLEVVYMNAPTTPDESRLYNKILKTLNVAYNASDKIENKLDQVEQVIEQIGLKVLVIDEIHNVISGTYSKQRNFLTTLKNLANELKIIIICAGNTDAQIVMTSDDQITTRFEEKILPSWNANPREFALLIKHFTEILPLRESTNYKDKVFLAHLFKMGEGLLGEYSKILKRAAEQAIKDKTEKITIETLKKISYQPPSSRSGR